MALHGDICVCCPCADLVLAQQPSGPTAGAASWPASCNQTGDKHCSNGVAPVRRQLLPQATTQLLLHQVGPGTLLKWWLTHVHGYMYCKLIWVTDSPCRVLPQLAATCMLPAHLPQTSSYASTPAAQTSTGGPYGLTPLLDSIDSSKDLLS